MPPASKKRGRKSRTRADRPFSLLMVDLMFTTVQFRGARSRKPVFCEIYRRHGRLPDAFDDDLLWDLIRQGRQHYAPIKYKDDERYWDDVNNFILDLAHEVVGSPRSLTQHNRTRGMYVHEEILTNAELYTYQRSFIQALRWLRNRGIRVVIVSNTKERYARQILTAMGLSEEFDAVYTSEELGLRKPLPEMWAEVLRRENELTGQDIEPHEVVHLGNSANSDTGAVELGMRVILYDRSRTLEGLATREYSEIDLYDQNPKLLSRYVDQRKILLHYEVRTLRDWLKAHALRRAA